MKKITSLFFSMALASSVFAGPVEYDSKDTKITPPPPLPSSCFGPGFELGFFGGGYLPTGGDYYHHSNRDGLGGGVLFDYFFNDYVGIQVNYGAFAPNPVHHNYGGDLVLRYPIQGACIAPYILVGGGGVVDGIDLGFFDVGAGVEYRIPSLSKVGIFADGTYHFVADGGDYGGNDRHDYVLVRLGVKIGF
jgi:hypothetical protein